MAMHADGQADQNEAETTAAEEGTMDEETPPPSLPPAVAQQRAQRASHPALAATVLDESGSQPPTVAEPRRNSDPALAATQPGDEVVPEILEEELEGDSEEGAGAETEEDEDDEYYDGPDYEEAYQALDTLNAFFEGNEVTLALLDQVKTAIDEDDNEEEEEELAAAPHGA